MTSRRLTLGSFPCLDPGELAEAADAAGFPDEFSGRANSIANPRGSQPGSAWVLLRRADLDQLDKTTAYTLKFYEDQSQAVEFKGYYLISGRAVGIDGDSKAAYLVELRDKRCILQQAKCDKQYNCQRAVPMWDASFDSTPTRYYYSASLNASALWTWAEIFDDLWDLLDATVAGTVPTLPYTPTSTPKNFTLSGVQAWDAIEQLLAAIGCVITYNQGDGTFSVVRLGTTQSGLESLESQNETSRLWTAKPKTDWLIAAPEKIYVCFPKIRLSSDPSTLAHVRWHSSATVTGALAGTSLTVWDRLWAFDYPAGTIANATECNGRANELANNIRNKILTTDPPGHVIYGGRKAFAPGSQVKEVVWRDYGDDWGFVTEVIKGSHALALPGPHAPRAVIPRGAITGDNSVNGWTRNQDCPTFTAGVTIPVDQFSSGYATGFASQTIKNTLPYQPWTSHNASSNSLGYWVEYDHADDSWRIVEPFSPPAATYALGSGGFINSGTIAISAASSRGGNIQSLASNTITIPATTVRTLLYRFSFLLSWEWPDATIRTGKVVVTAGGVTYPFYFAFGQNTLSGGATTYGTSHGSTKGTTIAGTLDVLLAAGNTIGISSTFDQSLAGTETLTAGHASLSLVGG